MATTIRTIHQRCDAILSKNTRLPNNSFLVEYKVNGESNYDIVSSQKMVRIFDHYYDLYGKDLIRIVSTEGRINPRLWDEEEYKKQ